MFWNGEKKNYGPFLCMGCNFHKATEPLRGDSLFFTIKSPGVLDVNLIDHERIKYWTVKPIFIRIKFLLVATLYL